MLEATASPVALECPDKTPSRCLTQCPPQRHAKPANPRETEHLVHPDPQANRVSQETPASQEPATVVHNRMLSKGSAAVLTTTLMFFATAPLSESTVRRQKVQAGFPQPEAMGLALLAKDLPDRPVPRDPMDNPETLEETEKPVHQVQSWMDPRWLGPLVQWDHQDPLDSLEKPVHQVEMGTQAIKVTSETRELPDNQGNQEAQDNPEIPEETVALALAIIALPHEPPQDFEQRNGGTKNKSEKYFIGRKNNLSDGFHCDFELTFIVFVLLISVQLEQKILHESF